MESIVALFVSIFVFGLVIEVSRILIKMMFVFLKITIVLILFTSIVSSIISPSKVNISRNHEICNRIDGCPIVDGVCIGCE